MGVNVEAEWHQQTVAQLLCLPRRQRLVLIWIYFQGLTQLQVAALLGVPLADVKHLTAQALQVMGSRTP